MKRRRKGLKRAKRLLKIKERRWKRHVITEEDREGQENYWCIDSGMKMRTP